MKVSDTHFSKNKNVSSFKAKIPNISLPQIGDEALKAASAAAGAVGMASVAMSNKNKEVEQVSYKERRSKIFDTFKNIDQNAAMSVHFALNENNIDVAEKLLKKFKFERDNWYSIVDVIENINEDNSEFALDILDKFDDICLINTLTKVSDKATLPILTDVLSNKHSSIYTNIFKINSFDTVHKLEFMQIAANSGFYTDEEIKEMIFRVGVENKHFAQFCAKSGLNSSNLIKQICAYKNHFEDRKFNSFELNNLFDVVYDAINDLEKGNEPKITPDEVSEIVAIAKESITKEDIARIDCNLKPLDLLQIEKDYINKVGLDSELKEKVIKLATGKDRVISPEYFVQFVNSVTNENIECVTEIFSTNPRKLDIDAYWFKGLLNNLKNCKSEKLLKHFKKVCCDNSLVVPANNGISDYIWFALNTKKFDNIEELFNKVQRIRKQILKNPELYVNGEYTNESEINEVFNSSNYNKIMHFIDVYQDDAVINTLLRQRFEKAEKILYELEYLCETSNFRESLKGMLKCTKPDGTEFTPTEKIKFIDMLRYYQDGKLNTTKLDKMVSSGVVDIDIINQEVLKNTLSKLGFSEEEISKIPKDKIKAWNSPNLFLFASQMNKFSGKEQKAFCDLVRSSIQGNFMEFIHDTNNDYGKANAITNKIFTERGYNYENWVNTSKDLEMKVMIEDKGVENIALITKQLSEDVEKLRETKAKKYFDTQMSAYIQDDKFVIPQTRGEIKKLVNALIKNLTTIWERAEQNAASDKPEFKIRGENTLTIKNHIEQIIKTLSETEGEKIGENLDLTIKMWDRKPEKDIFQGNYSTCCIAMGGSNAIIMPHYITNTSCNMIEVIDNVSGEVISNALCYFAQIGDEDVFILDNIEIRNSRIPSEEGGKVLRDKMAEYAQNITQSVTGKKLKVYMSDKNNDVTTKDLEKTSQEVKFLGGFDTDYVYFDLYGGVLETYVREDKNPKIYVNSILAYLINPADAEKNKELSKPVELKPADIKERRILCQLFSS